jgi:hypothetical protein
MFPGPTASITVILYANAFPQENALSFVNVCTGIQETFLASRSTINPLTKSVFPLTLPVGEYLFLMDDLVGDGTFVGIYIAEKGEISVLSP